MRRILDRVSLWLMVISGVAVVLMMLAMTLDAVLRKTVGTLPGAYEGTIGLLLIVMFLPQGYGQMRRANVSVDILTSRLSPQIRAILGGIGAVLGVGVFGLLTVASGLKAWDSTLIREIMPGQAYYPMWPFRWVVPLGAGMLTLQFLLTVFNEFGKVRGRQ